MKLLGMKEKQKPKTGFQKFIDWNKKVFNDTTPVFAWQHMKDEDDEELGIYFLGSQFRWKKENKQRQIKSVNKEVELIEQ